MVNLWFVIIGALFIFMALMNSLLKRLPLSVAMIYLLLGFGLAAVNLFHFDPLTNSALLERITEIVVITSLFTAGLKLRMPLSDRRWVLPVRLAFVSMSVTVGLIALIGVFGLGLPVGAAILLGAILAPTDPVLASDVQVENPNDQDRLRFSLTGEAGLNDGTAFPFVMLGLGLMGLHEIGDWGWRWLVVDVVWAIAGGLMIGALFGALVGKLVLYLRSNYREAVGLDDFLSLGLIALSYGVALLLYTYGFLAVFAAGLALRRVERQASQGKLPSKEVEAAAHTGEKQEVATDPEQAPAYMAAAVLGFNEQLERIAVVGMVVLLGGMLDTRFWRTEALWFVPILLLVIRPVSTWIGMLGSPVATTQQWFIGWFGIRGIGSLYYLMYSIEHGLPDQVAGYLISLTLLVVTVSIFVHGISVTPLMMLYQRIRPADEDES
jgi:NhaP-type Na+/H+ or K+/H+ antiporter